jgi:NAD(P)-dependent dehydrogenase (short-subunit alcohol dehydrogenase family)
MSSAPTRVVVMGGSSGIGEATARLFAAGGAEVIITGRDGAKLAPAQTRSGASRGAVVDGSVPAAVAQFFAGLGAFDHLVLALSGGKGAGPFGVLSLDELRAGFEGKFWAHLTTLQAALPMLRGSVTLISAGSARSALPGTAGLAAINGALEAMVGPLAAELAPIRVNAVSPGVIDTPWWDEMPREAKEQFMLQAAHSLPVARVGRPEDVAAAIVMLAHNGFITGTVVEVDGGGHLARG